eukprot:TRINITY_DN1909_c0_g1_i1.p1 TRINITY_DN1909_c0_g1~~TRINITY_DN1909_c0_g1_i1.p1  ORF type:complete len:267 (+),score=64.20 TRINITY_DN1909_c0_g1_i1:42-842(+)
MDLFSTYEQDFNDVFSSVQGRIRSIPTLVGPGKQDAIRAAEAELADAEEILNSMNLAARNVTAAQQRTQLQQKIREYETDITQAKKDLRGAQNRLSEAADRESLFGGNSNVIIVDNSQSQRDTMAQDTTRLTRTGDTLRQALIEAESTIDVGQDTLQNLHRQRETMERADYRLDDINDKLAQATRIIRGMARRVLTNKLIMSVIILVMICAIILIIWLKFGRHGDDSSSSGEYNTTSTTTDTTTTSTSADSTTSFASITSTTTGAI